MRGRKAEKKEKVFHVSCSPNQSLPALWADGRVQLGLARLTDVLAVAALEDLYGGRHLVEADRTFWGTWWLVTRYQTFI